MRTRKDYRSASVESYKRFRESHPAIVITYDKFCEILYTFSLKIRDYILETGEFFKFPHGMGHLSINKKKTRRLNKHNKIILPIDWVQTKKEGRLIYNFNDHTEGYSYKWLWLKSKALFKFSTLWAFKPYKVNSRKLAEYLNRPNSKYYLLYREYQR